VRDGFSRLVVDWHGDPLWYVSNIPTRNELLAARIVSDRAGLLDVSRLAEEAALDHYAYVRDAFLQRRRSLIYDGDPPPEPNPAKSSDAGAETRALARAQAELPLAQITNQWGEKVITAGDEELTPAREFARFQAPPAVALSAEPVSRFPGPVYEPRIPLNHETLLTISAGARVGFAPASLKP
jgi:hypothetical protein